MYQMPRAFSVCLPRSCQLFGLIFDANDQFVLAIFDRVGDIERERRVAALMLCRLTCPLTKTSQR